MSKKLAISRTSDWKFLRNVIYRLSKTSSTYHKCLHVQIDKLSGNFFWLKNCSIYFLQFSYDLTIGLRSLIKNHSDSTKFVSEKRVSPRLTHKGLIHRLGRLFKVILYKTKDIRSPTSCFMVIWNTLCLCVTNDTDKTTPREIYSVYWRPQEVLGNIRHRREITKEGHLDPGLYI